LPRETVKGGVEHGAHDDDVLPEEREKGEGKRKKEKGKRKKEKGKGMASRRRERREIGGPPFKVAEDFPAVLRRVTWLA
jgi:hypothetical protein